MHVYIFAIFFQHSHDFKVRFQVSKTVECRVKVWTPKKHPAGEGFSAECRGNQNTLWINGD